MKDLFITANFLPKIGGIEEYVFNLCKEWNDLTRENNLCSNIKEPVDNFFGQKQEGSVIVLAHSYRKNKKAEKEFDQKQNFKIIRRILDFPWKWIKPKWILSPIFAYQIAKSEKIKRVHSASGFASFISAYFLKRSLGLPYFIYVYGLDFLTLQKKWLKRRLLAMIFKQADGFVGCSKFTQSLIKNFCQRFKIDLSKKKSIVLYPGVDAIKARADLDQRHLREKYNLEDKKVLLSVGRLIGRKGFDKVIEAMPLILKKLPNTVYFIVGEGLFRKELEKIVKNLNLENAVKFLGSVSDKSLPYFYNLCDILLMPSRFIQARGDVEGFGKVFLEANLYGKPVIGGNSGGVPEAILDGKTGFLVDPESPGDIAEKAIRLLEDDDLRLKMGQAGRARAVNEFNWKKLISEFKREIER